MNALIAEICNEAIKMLKNINYNDSTIKEYQKTFKNLEDYALKQGAIYYTPLLGSSFSADTISERTGKYSLYREKRRKRCMHLFNSYLETGYFDLSMYRTPLDTPKSEMYQKLHSEYVASLELKTNTINSYRNVSCKFLTFLEKSGVYDVSDATPRDIISFFMYLKKSWDDGSLRIAVSSLRSFFTFINHRELLIAMDNIKTIRTKKIIPVLNTDEHDRIWGVLKKSDIVSLRDKAIILLSLIFGMRACDIVNLKLSDINWSTNTITFVQQKTGNLIILPLFPSMGNAIYDYITKERPESICNEVFLRSLAPYTPLSGHSACYRIIKRVFENADISCNHRICGTRLLRHNAASNMLKQETSIETIAAILGHSSPDSTNIYITTNEVALKQCVLPLIGITKGVLS